MLDSHGTFSLGQELILSLLVASAQVGAQNVQLALSLVGYPEEVEKAMEYVFGATLVCKDPKAAQAVTFHPVW